MASILQALSHDLQFIQLLSILIFDAPGILLIQPSASPTGQIDLQKGRYISIDDSSNNPSNIQLTVLVAKRLNAALNGSYLFHITSFVISN